MKAKPLYYSKFPDGTLPDEYFSSGLVGAKMLGLEPMPVQREIWNLLEAKQPDGEFIAGIPALPLFDNNAIEVPRRAGKTEAIFSEAVGRCMTYKDYDITYCAQSGVKSRERFYGVLRRLSRNFPHGWKARESRGEERIEFTITGGNLRFLPPKASSFRGDAQDWIIFDEAQEVSEEDAEDLIGSVMPVFDTRDSGQLTIAGTAGKSRDGLLWEALENGRLGKWGILEYAMPPGLNPDDPATWLLTHPGPAGVSEERALTVLTKRHGEMSAEMFYREYLGIWPMAASSSAFNMEQWQSLGREMNETKPVRFGLAFDVAPGGRHASVMVLWRDETGIAWLEVIKDQAGSNWVAEFVGNFAVKYKVPIGYDTAGVDTLSVADEIARRFKNRVTLRGLTTLEFATSCATFSNLVQNNQLRHFRQDALNTAVENASRRPIRDAGWAWGRKQSTGVITSLVAGTVALKMYDDLPVARNLSILTANAG